MSNIETLAALSGLSSLQLGGHAVRDLQFLAGPKGLRSPHLAGCPNVTDVSCLAELPMPQELRLWGVGPGIDLEPLAANRKLAVDISRDQEVRGGAALGRRLEVA